MILYQGCSPSITRTGGEVNNGGYNENTTGVIGGEGMIYCVFYIMISAVGCAVLIAYMKMMVWKFLNDFRWKDTLVALISPMICLIVSGVCAWGIYCDYTDTLLRRMTLATMILILAATIGVAWQSAVKHYVAEDVEPNYGSVGVVVGYSALLFTFLFLAF